MERLYIIHKDPAQFKGHVLNTMPFVEIGMKNGQDILNHTYVDYTDGVTFAKYNEQHGGDLIAVSWEEFERGYYRPHLKSMQDEFKETTEERFIDALECLPPKRWTRENSKEFFFVGECFTADLYSAYVRLGNKYYTALRSIHTPKENIFNLSPVV